MKPATTHPQVIAVYSESGGVTKSTSAVSLAMEAAIAGLNVVLIDLDPRGASTKWLNVQPSGPGLHVGAILAADDPTGWAEEVAVTTAWHPRLRMIPSSREVAIREKESADQAEIRLKLALAGINADLVVIDCPNRQGGPLTLNALVAATDLVMAAAPTKDGVDGIEGAIITVNRYRKNCAARGIPTQTLVRVRGIIIGDYVDTITPVFQRRAIETITEAWGDLLCKPFIPRRGVVNEAREAEVYFGEIRKDEQFQYPKAEIVARSYRAVAAQVIDQYSTNGENK